MLYDHETFCLAAGMLLGMLYYHKTGWACGGIITPGLIAMHIGDPGRLAVSFAAGMAAWLLLEGLVRLFAIYGRQRLVAAMLIALALRYPVVSICNGTSLWLSWMVPGLIAADMQRQGVLPTLSAVIATAVATAASIQLLRNFLF